MNPLDWFLTQTDPAVLTAIGGLCLVVLVAWGLALFCADNAVELEGDREERIRQFSSSDVKAGAPHPPDAPALFRRRRP